MQTHIIIMKVAQNVFVINQSKFFKELIKSFVLKALSRDYFLHLLSAVFSSSSICFLAFEYSSKSILFAL